MQQNTPDGPSPALMTATSKEKGKAIVDEHWPELSKQRGTGSGKPKILLGSNGTVTQGKPNNTQRKLEMNGEAVQKPWTNLFATKRLATRGMNLNYIPLVIVDGEKIVEILPEDVTQDDEKWAPSLVVYVVGTSPSIGAMERFIMGQGNFSTKPIILYHIDGYFVVRFANEEERDMVLCSGPHHLLRRPIIMKPWVLEFNFKEEILTTIPLWVKLPNMPLNCWNSVVLSKIGSSVGKPLYVDECTTQTSRISFARILMEIDVTRPLAKKCLQVGHACVDKQAAPIQIQKKSQGQGQRK
ncbi:hypothetical protein KY289_020597 [Solanum tuberosum]|nr:hypothetical protein KY289_020597 [Solanum tuberosum]